MLPQTYLPLFSKLPANRESRWMLVLRFVDFWSRPIAPGDGYSEADIEQCERELGHRLPAALREWYLIAGRRRDLWSQQDRLTTPNELFQFGRHENHLVFYAENQGCEVWGVRDSDILLEDPPVYRLKEDPCQVSPSVSAFAIQTLLREKIMGAPCCGWQDFWEQRRLLADLGSQYSLCDLPLTYWSVMEPLRFYEGEDILLMTHADQWLFVGARNSTARRKLPVEIFSRLEWVAGEFA